MSEKREALFALRETIVDAQAFLVDSERFMRVLHGSFEVLALDEGALAHRFGVSTVTVKRWRNGNAIPYKLMRAPVYKFLLARVDQALEEP